MFSPRTKTWTFPNLKAPAGPAEVYLAVEEEEEDAVAFGSPFRGVGVLEHTGPDPGSGSDSDSAEKWRSAVTCCSVVDDEEQAWRSLYLTRQFEVFLFHFSFI